MRKLAWLVALLGLVAVGAEAQDFIRYVPAPVAGTSGGGATFTAPVLIPNGSNGAGGLAFAADPTRGMANVTNGITIGNAARGIYIDIANGSFLPYGSMGFGGGSWYAPLAIGIDRAYDIGTVSLRWRSVFVSDSIQSSNSMTLVDNTKTTFATVDVAAASYGGGDVIWTLYCADAADRVSRSGRLPFAIQNTLGTETCAVGTTSVTADVTNNAKAFTTVTFTCADGGANKIQLEVLADCTIAAPTALTIQYRLDMPKVNTVAPGT